MNIVRCRSKEAFTLMEIMVVLIIISIIVGFGITGYDKSQERTYVKSALSNLKLIQSAQDMYKVRHGYYYPLSGSVDDYTVLNENLNINIMPTVFKYYSCTHTGNLQYECEAFRGTNDYKVVLKRVWVGGSYDDYKTQIGCEPMGTGSCP